MKNIKGILGLIMICGGFIVAMGCVIASIIFSFQNPDMTELRRFLEYPGPTIIGLISLVIVYAGKEIIVRSDKE